MSIQINTLFYTVDKTTQKLTQLKGKPTNSNRSDLRWYELFKLINKIIEDEFAESLVVRLEEGFEKIKSEKSLVIVFLSRENITDHSLLLHLTDSEFRPISNSSDGNKIKVTRHSDYPPMLAIGPEDIFTAFNEINILEPNKEKNLRENELDSRIKFLDSSIWHSYICTEEKGAASLTDRIKSKLGQLISHHQQGLYKASAALASLEFQLRMLRNSYIAKFGDTGHHICVTPFKFHSETLMERKAKELLGFLQEDREADLTLEEEIKWKILLVDDQAAKNISTLDSNSHLTKKEFIKSLFPEFKAETLSIITPDSKETEIIKLCINNISESPFDIILIDYLLGSNDFLKRREYGFEFLKIIKYGKRPDGRLLRAGPRGRFWLFPISSFPYAFFDKIQQIGINPLNEKWFLSIGADPIATPHKFRYELLKFMVNQISTYFLHPKKLRDIIRNRSTITSDTEWAKAFKNDIDEFKDLFTGLRRDHQDTSSFAESIFRFLYRQKDLKKFVKNLSAILGKIKTHRSQKPEKKVAFYLDIIDRLKALGNGSQESIKEYLIAYHYILNRIEHYIKPEGIEAPTQEALKIFIDYPEPLEGIVNELKIKLIQDWELSSLRIWDKTMRHPRRTIATKEEDQVKLEEADVILLIDIQQNEDEVLRNGINLEKIEGIEEKLIFWINPSNDNWMVKPLHLNESKQIRINNLENFQPITNPFKSIIEWVKKIKMGEEKLSTPEISNAKNVVSHSHIKVQGDFHIGDRNTYVVKNLTFVIKPG